MTEEIVEQPLSPPSEVDQSTQYASGPELNPDTEVTSFVDHQGNVREPNPLAAEVVASKEVQEATNNYFDHWSESVQTTKSHIEAYEVGEESTRETIRTAFTPFDEAFLEEVFTKAKDEAPGLITTRHVLKEVVTEERRHFRKRKVAHTEYVDEPAIKTGQTPGFTEKELKEIGELERLTSYHLKENNLTPEKVLEVAEGIKRKTVKLAEELLLGTELGFDRDYSKGTRLPMLATRLAELEEDAPEKLTLDALEQLVPEVKPLVGMITHLSDEASKTMRRSEAWQLHREIVSLLPFSRVLPIVYYNEQDFQKIRDLERHLESALGEDYPEVIERFDYKGTEERSRKVIENFFDYGESADALLFHGTVFGPRIIANGSLRPTAAMADEEFTFNTNRSRNRSLGLASDEGSKGVHWTAELNGAYAHDSDAESYVRNILHNRGFVDSQIDKELAKGPLGFAIFGMRLGDVVTTTPYGGGQHEDHDNISRRSEGRPTQKRAIVQFTDSGWQKVVKRQQSRHPSTDVTFLATPRTRDERFDYGYPINDMLVGIGSKSEAEVKSALQSVGWSEQKIGEQTFVFHEADRQEVTEGVWAYAQENPKYPRSLILTLSEDV